MAGTARILLMRGQSVMNGAGYYSDVTSGLPNQSGLAYQTHVLREPYIQSWSSGVSASTYVAGTLRQNANNEYMLLSPGGGNTANAPVHTSGDNTGADGYNWRYLRPALADVPTWAATTGYDVGDVFRTPSGNRYYQVVYRSGACLSGATEPTGTSAAGITDGDLRLKYINAASGVTRKLNYIYSGKVKIWNNSDKFVPFTLVNVTAGTTAAGNGKDADGVNISIGPQIPFAAHMLSRWNDNHNYIVKHAVDGRSLGFLSGVTNYSVQSYDAASQSLLLSFCDSLYAAMNSLLGVGLTAWASSATLSADVIRTNGGNVYKLINAGGGTTADAPVHTDGVVTAGDGYAWKFQHTIYDDVDVIALAEEHGEQDSVYSTLAANYRYNQLNLWRRIHHRFQFSDGNGLYLGYIEPFVPRNQDDIAGGAYKIAFSQMVRQDIKDALQEWSGIQTGSAVTPSENSDRITYGAFASYTKTYDMYTSPYWPASASDELHWSCAGSEEMVNRWWASFDVVTPSEQTWSESQTTSFYGGGSAPALTETTGPDASYDPAETVTAVLANSGLNGGSSGDISWHLDHDADNPVSTGLNLSFVPDVYNGHIIRARYRDPNGYWATYHRFIHILAPRTAFLAYCTANTITPRHWLRGSLNAAGTNLAANGTPDNIANFTGAESGIYAVRASGATSCNIHPNGIAMQKTDALRWNQGTTDNATNRENATIRTVSNNNFTLFFKGRIWWKPDEKNNLYGTLRLNSTANFNGGSIGMPAAATSAGEGSDFKLTAYYANDLTHNAVSGTGGTLDTADIYDAGDQIISALVKNTNAWKLYWRLPNGTIASKEITGMSAMDADGYPAAIGWQAATVTGLEGLVEEAIGLEHAITDSSTIDAIIAELAATGPEAGGSKLLIQYAQH